ncbi:MAG TPA: pilus assembly protein TadG-related protein [Acidimicrobiia bacterium]
MLERLAEKIEERMDEKGVALPFVALMLVLLLGMTALAVDLGWLYLNGSRIQRGADAAALAGVVYLPGDLPEVTTQSVNGAKANGWNVGEVNGNGIPGGDANVRLNWQDLSENRLEVRLTAPVPTFFLRVFGMNEVTISRRATAEYIKPVPIGSPFNTFGDGADFIYASISGRYLAHIHGDPYLTRCDWSAQGPWSGPNAMDSDDCRDSTDPQSGWGSTEIRPGDVDSDTSAFNPEYRSEGTIGFIDEDGGDDADGYYYGIEVQPGRTQLTVELYDPMFNRRSNWDSDCLTFSAVGCSGNPVVGPHTRFRLYEPDETPLNPRDGLTMSRRRCNQVYSPTAGASLNWTTLCTLSTNVKAGIWVLRVSTNNGSGNNHYGIRVTTQGPGPDEPRVYGINEVSIYTTDQDSDARLFLAQVDPVHAGKVLIVRFYDAGEDDNLNAQYTIQRPDGSTAKCVWRSDNESFGNPNDPPSSWPSCVISTTYFQAGIGVVGRFNGQWLEARVEIPQTYSCDMTQQLGCWWKVKIDNEQPHDRTTWSVSVVGNPVRLVPNEP